MYQFEYILNDDDYMQFNQSHMNTTPAMKKQILFLRLIVPVVLFIVLVVLDLTTDYFLLAIRVAILVIISLVWIFLVKPINMLFFKLHIKFLKKDGKLPYGRHNSLVFDEDYINSSDELSESKTKYCTIEKIVVGKNAIYIYITAASAIILPLSVFETLAKKDEFLTFLKERIG